MLDCSLVRETQMAEMLLADGLERVLGLFNSS